MYVNTFAHEMEVTTYLRGRTTTVDKIQRKMGSTTRYYQNPFISVPCRAEQSNVTMHVDRYEAICAKENDIRGIHR